MTDAEDQLKKLEKDQEEIIAVETKIDAIGEVTLESAASIKAARDAYDKLSDSLKKLVSNYDILKAAETKYHELQKEAEQIETDKAAAKGVEKNINSIGEVTLAKAELIRFARAAYDALTDVQKKYISQDTLSILTAAEEKLKELIETDFAAAVEAAKAELETYKDLTLYRDAEQKKLKAIIASAKEELDKIKDKSEIQPIIDKQKTAMDRIKTAAQLTEEENKQKPEGGKTIKDEKYNVSITGEEITSDMKLIVTPLKLDSDSVKKMQKTVTSDYVITKLYNLTLYKDKKAAMLTKEATLSFHIGEKYNEQTLTVLHNVDENIEQLTGKVKEGVLTVKIKSLGDFSVVLKAESIENNEQNQGDTTDKNKTANTSKQGTNGVKTGDSTPVTMLFLTIICAVAIIITCQYQKKKQQDK